MTPPDPQEPFDWRAFMDDVQNPDNGTKAAILGEAVSDEMGYQMAELAPRLWAVIQREMAKDPANNIHLNAVTNAAIFAVLGWIAACTPRGSTLGVDNDEALRTKVTKALEISLITSREQGVHMGHMATNVGQLKLLEDAVSGMGEIVVANSMIIKGIHGTIKNMGGKPPA